MKDKKPSWAQAGSYSLLSYVAQLGLAFVSFLILVRLLPKYEFGVWMLFMTIITFAEMARMGLLQNAMVKYCMEEEEAYGSILTSGAWLNFWGTVVLSAILIIAAYPLAEGYGAPELVALVWWYPGYALIHGSARFVDNIQMAHHDFKGIFWSKMAYGVVFIVAILAVWWWEMGELLFVLPVLQLIAGVPSLLISLRYRPDYLRFGKLQQAWVRKLFHFGKYVMGTNFSSMLFNKADLMMVGAFLNPAAIAVYNVATRVTNYAEVPISGLAQAIYPRLTAAAAQGGKQTVAEWYERSVGLLLAIVLPLAIGVVLFAKPVVWLLAGSEYEDAVPLLQILILAMLAKPWTRLFGITMDAIGQPKINFYTLIGALVFNIGMNALLIPLMGIAGAAVASLLSIWGLALLGIYLINKELPIRQHIIFSNFVGFYRSPRRALKLEQL